MSQTSNRAIVIGAGFGGLAAAMRLQSMGFETTVVEALDKPGGRAYVREVDGYTFDMGPTVITVPHFIEELFALDPGVHGLSNPDFPPETLAFDARVTKGISGGPRTSEYCTIRPITPFYRIYFDDGTWFDYDGDGDNTRRQIAEICPEDLEGYERFHEAAGAIFERGFLELGYTTFLTVPSMLKVLPDLLKLDAVRNLFRFSSQYFSHDKLRQVFSFETLLVGGNPMSVPAIYAMIHFVEKTWGVHYCMGGTGALVSGFVRKFEEMGGTLRTSAPVDEILVTTKSGGKPGRFSSRVARGVRLESGEVLEADVVVSNADYATTMMRMLPPATRPTAPDWVVRAKRYSMSLLVIYFGFKDDPEQPLEPGTTTSSSARATKPSSKRSSRRRCWVRTSANTCTFRRSPTRRWRRAVTTRPTHSFPCPTTEAESTGTRWAPSWWLMSSRCWRTAATSRISPSASRTRAWVTPDYFETTLRSHLGNGFGLEPVLTQSAWFRPHNRVSGIDNLYLVGANTQPGAGTPSVMMSAKMTARCVADDHPEVVAEAEQRAQAQPKRVHRTAG